MTQPTNHPKFQLKKGIQYTICNPSAKCVGTETLGYTQDNYIVDLVVQRDSDGKLERATAYMPNQAVCLSPGLPGQPECQLDLLFEGKQLDKLFSSSPPPTSDQPAKDKRSPSPQSTKVNAVTPPKHTHPEYIGEADLLLPVLLAGLVGGAAFSAIQVLVTLLRKKKRDQNTSRVSRNQVAQNTEKRSELPESDRIAREVQKQLFPARQKIQDLDNKVSDLEIKLIEQYQKDQSLNIKAPPISSTVPDISFAMKEPATYLPPPPPPPLSIDIIKQAVLDWSYQAIASYQFDFVTETIQSQKGEVDIKSFSIDGNQDQSDSRSQSEFIAISCQGASYLIPNILQNAADPARTISRHLERIYKKGMGSDLKNLAKLAIVRRTGDCYELVEMGQVA